MHAAVVIMSVVLIRMSKRPPVRGWEVAKRLRGRSIDTEITSVRTQRCIRFHRRSSRRRSLVTAITPAPKDSSYITKACPSSCATRSWLETGGEPEPIGILVRDRGQRDRVVSGLAECGATVRALDSDKATTGYPQALTMHDARCTGQRGWSSPGYCSSASETKLCPTSTY